MTFRLERRHRASVFFLQGGIGNLLFQYSASLRAARALGCRMVYAQFEDGPIQRLANYLGRDLNCATSAECFRVGAQADCLSPAKIRTVKALSELGAFARRTTTDGLRPEDMNALRTPRLFLGYFQDPEWHDGDSIGEVVDLLKAHAPVGLHLDPSEVIGVHLRRSDYLRGRDNLPVSFFLSQVEKLDPARERVVLVVGDDPLASLALEIAFIARGWITQCSEAYSDPGIPSSAWRDFHLLSMCDHLVLSNSTFAWWIAALSGSRSVGTQQIVFPTTRRIPWALPSWTSPSVITGTGEVDAKAREDVIRFAIKGAVTPSA